MSYDVNQRGAKADGNIVGRDMTVHNHLHGRPKGIEALLISLRKQIEENHEVSDLIDELSRYYVRQSHDGIDGLEDKLNAAGLAHKFDDAIEKKERFAKLLEKMSLYSSAQKIFAFFLAKTENTFSHVIHPKIADSTESEVNQMIIDLIAEPICQECDGEDLLITYDTVFGMVYWLAEQCFVRWHQ